MGCWSACPGWETRAHRTSRPGSAQGVTGAVQCPHTHARSEETPASGCCGQAWATLGPLGLGEPRAGSKMPISHGKRARGGVDCKSGQTSNGVGLRSVTRAERSTQRGLAIRKTRYLSYWKSQSYLWCDQQLSSSACSPLPACASSELSLLGAVQCGAGRDLRVQREGRTGSSSRRAGKPFPPWAPGCSCTGRSHRAHP